MNMTASVHEIKKSVTSDEKIERKKPLNDQQNDMFIITKRMTRSNNDNEKQKILM